MLNRSIVITMAFFQEGNRRDKTQIEYTGQIADHRQWAVPQVEFRPRS